MSDEITPPSGYEPPTGPPISDDDADALLRGAARPGHEDLARTVAALRSVPQPPVGVGPELDLFFVQPVFHLRRQACQNLAHESTVTCAIADEDLHRV